MQPFNLKYRPNSFSNFIGNESSIKGLLNSYPDWPHAFLLVGESGSGKTTLARLIAKQLKCDPINLKEIDASQDRGIDSIRALVHTAYHRPLVGKTKVYIFDECQGLTKDAQGSMLKITEEPPKNTYFILCSTDPHKLTKALRERCQQGLIELHPIINQDLGKIIKHICDNEGIKIEGVIKDIANLCIKNAEGIPRKAIMFFEKFYRYESAEEVAKNLKDVGDFMPEDFLPFIEAIKNKNTKEFISLFAKKKDKNYESFRITFGNICKKQLLYAIINGDKDKIKYFQMILEAFVKPVDNTLGDIELIYRFSYWN